MASHNKHFVVKYLECMHNYAATSMGYVLDGCGEFCPTGAPGTPESFICAACQCHRNFHRKMEVEEEVEAGLELPNLSVNHPRYGGPVVVIDNPIQRLRHPRQMFDKNNVGTKMEMDEGDIEVADQSNFKRKKNTSSSVRMKLNPYQKERIWAFAEEVMGWRWAGNNEQVIPFCSEIGITPEFLKNWINNNRRRIGHLRQTI
ncbi:unnamed protein product [Withania somnifera]